MTIRKKQNVAKKITAFIHKINYQNYFHKCTTKLYYSSLDKKKQSATMAVRIKSYKIERDHRYKTNVI